MVSPSPFQGFSTCPSAWPTILSLPGDSDEGEQRLVSPAAPPSLGSRADSLPIAFCTGVTSRSLPWAAAVPRRVVASSASPSLCYGTRWPVANATQDRQQGQGSFLTHLLRDHGLTLVN